MYVACICLLLSATALLCYCLRRHYSYWTRRGIPTVRPTWLLGNLGPLLRMQRSTADFIRDLYTSNAAAPFIGIHIFHKPALLLRDPELIKRVLVRDFTSFCDRYSNGDTRGDPIGSQNIFFLKNPAWKEVRLKLTPFFTAARLKQMFALVERVGRNLDAHLMEHSGEQELIEMKEFCCWYTTDVIATVAYGVNANTFQNPNGEFRRNGRAIFEFRAWRAVHFVVVFFLPQLVGAFGIKVVPPKETAFFRSTINYVMRERELSGEVRNDLIDILLDFRNATRKKQKGAAHSDANNNNNSSSGEVIFDGDLLIAQATLFFTAGFESSSATMSFALYELAKHPEVQARVRQEIRDALERERGDVTQALIDSLTYMQMVIAEVLRLYPPLPFLDRECTAERYSLQPYGDYCVERSTPIYIPVYGLHTDPKYFPDPTRFDPERFSPMNRKLIPPYTYMPFGLGSHACVGERFAMLQTKVGLLYFLRNHCVATCARTQPHMQFNRRAVILQADGGIYLKVQRDPISI